MNKKNQKVTKKRIMRTKQKNNKTNKRKTIKAGNDNVDTHVDYNNIEDYEWYPIDEEIDDFYKTLKTRAFSKVEEHDWDTEEEDFSNEDEINYCRGKIKRLKDEIKQLEKEIKDLNKEIKTLKKDKTESRIIGNIKNIEAIQKKIVKNNELITRKKNEIESLINMLNYIKEKRHKKL